MSLVPLSNGLENEIVVLSWERLLRKRQCKSSITCSFVKDGRILCWSV